jgi:MFS family permease
MSASATSPGRDPSSARNIPLFIAFRALFNGRFYYPVFAILFLDYGLSLEQFADLNAIWALTIILLEVPSGVLADVVGRKKLVVAAAALMVVEMAFLSFVPLGDLTVVFAVFVINRIASGAAEAMASGADEALAYDSLPDGNREDRWANVLERAMRWQYGAFVAAALIGALVYDAAVMNRLFAFLGFDLEISKETAIRLPIWLNLGTAIATLMVALSLREVRAPEERPNTGKLRPLLGVATRQTLHAGRWILRTRPALCLILIAIFHDSIIRLFLTLEASYLRLIELPEASFGLIATAMSVVGLFMPTVARKLLKSRTPRTNFIITWGITLVGLAGLALLLPYWGAAFVAVLMTGMVFINFFLSNYLNSIVEPARRATVLSFRGLAMNVAYGLATFSFGRIVILLEEGLQSPHPGWADSRLNERALELFFQWQPLYFLLGGFLLYGVVRFLMGRGLGDFRKIPDRTPENAEDQKETGVRDDNGGIGS